MPCISGRKNAVANGDVVSFLWRFDCKYFWKKAHTSNFVQKDTSSRLKLGNATKNMGSSPQPGIPTVNAQQTIRRCSDETMFFQLVKRMFEGSGVFFEVGAYFLIKLLGIIL